MALKAEGRQRKPFSADIETSKNEKINPKEHFTTRKKKMHKKNVWPQKLGKTHANNNCNVAKLNEKKKLNSFAFDYRIQCIAP